jgi:hypothetical protein
VRVLEGSDACIASPQCEHDREAIRAALNEIIASNWFRNTKRCREFLRYAVEETLAGRADKLTERNIGVKVFARAPNYDTNEDGVVRTSALEVRKRLAQYYHELRHEPAVRIEIASGGYSPDFRLAEIAAVETEPLPKSPALAAPPPVKPAFRRYAVWFGTFLLLAIAAYAAFRLRSSDPLNAFWEPMWNGADSLIVVVGSEQPAPQQQAGPPEKTEPTTLDVVRTDRAGFSDTVVASQVTGLLEARGKRVDVRRASTLTLDDLRTMPAIFVGNTPWTYRLSADLRFQVKRDDAAGTLEITDRGTPTPWKVNALAPYSERTQDWALITRFRDARTEKPVLLLCGLGSDGTSAAGELVSRPELLKTFIQQAPVGWKRKNFQMVIEVDLIKGSAGPPHVLATHFW